MLYSTSSGFFLSSVWSSFGQIRHVTEFESNGFWHFSGNPPDSLTRILVEFKFTLWLCPIWFLAVAINKKKTTTRINYSIFIDICRVWRTLLVTPDDWIYFFTECRLLLIIENGSKSSIVDYSFFVFSAMQLTLVPVTTLYGIHLQNPHPTDADFSWLDQITWPDTQIE